MRETCPYKGITTLLVRRGGNNLRRVYRYLTGSDDDIGSGELASQTVMMMLVAENWRRMADGSHHRSEHAAMTRTAPWELTKQPNKQAKATKVQRTAADPGRVGNQSSCHQHTQKKSTMRMAPAPGGMAAQKTSSIQAGAKRELSQIA